MDEEKSVTKVTEKQAVHKSDTERHDGMTDEEIDDIYARMCSPRPVLVVISGPSGVGKDATLNLMKERADFPFHFVVTATTRPKRPTEVDGIDYHFRFGW